MFDSTKILRGSLVGSSLGKKYPGEVYLSLCYKKNGPIGDYFVSDVSYSSVVSQLEEMHEDKSASDAGGSFLLEGPWSEVAEHKYVIHIRDAYYHLVINTLATILKIYEDDPDAIFIICTGTIDAVDTNQQGRDFIKAAEFLSTILHRNDIPFWFLKTYYELPNYLELNSSSTMKQTLGIHGHRPIDGVHSIYKLSNVTIVDDYNNPMGLTLRDLDSLIDKYVLSHVDRGQVTPETLVYISRSCDDLATSAFVDPLVVESGYVNNYRLYNEVLLEQYLESKGFLIMRDGDFSSIEEQIAFINDAKLVIGATGTGLINTLFMHSNQVVIELRMEMLIGGGRHNVLMDYANFSYAKGHKYIGLDVSDKQGGTAITKLAALFEILDLYRI